MKKLFSIYRRYMLRPIIYKTVTRASVVAVLCLLWQRYVSDGHFTLWQAPALLCGAALCGWAWLCYLKLDGMTVHHLLEDLKTGGRKKYHPTRSIVDFADEKIISFDELEPDERTFCSMAANLLLGVPLVVVGLAAGLF